MGVKTKTSFSKGQQGNPKGRPLGKYSERKKKFIEIQKLAANDVQAVYKEIRAKMKEGEAWAYQLYVKDFMPKKAFDHSTLVKVEEGESRLEALIKGLSNFEELTHEEILNEIKVLNIKQSELDSFIDKRAEQDREEGIMTKVYAIGRAIDYQEKLNEEKLK
jgi:hypothetical protein